MSYRFFVKYLQVCVLTLSLGFTKVSYGMDIKNYVRPSLGWVLVDISLVAMSSLSQLGKFGAYGLEEDTTWGVWMETLSSALINGAIGGVAIAHVMPVNTQKGIMATVASGVKAHPWEAGVVVAVSGLVVIGAAIDARRVVVQAKDSGSNQGLAIAAGVSELMGLPVMEVALLEALDTLPPLGGGWRRKLIFGVCVMGLLFSEEAVIAAEMLTGRFTEDVLVDQWGLPLENPWGIHMLDMILMQGHAFILFGGGYAALKVLMAEAPLREDHIGKLFNKALPMVSVLAMASKNYNSVSNGHTAIAVDTGGTTTPLQSSNNLFMEDVSSVESEGTLGDFLEYAQYSDAWVYGLGIFAAFGTKGEIEYHLDVSQVGLEHLEKKYSENIKFAVFNTTHSVLDDESVTLPLLTNGSTESVVEQDIKFNSSNIVENEPENKKDAFYNYQYTVYWLNQVTAPISGSIKLFFVYHFRDDAIKALHILKSDLSRLKCW